MGAANGMGPPFRVGRYAIFDVIGSGGMASVHLARVAGPRGFSRTVAVKRMHAQRAMDPCFVESFLDEAKLASRVHHANVVTTLDIVVAGGELLLVLDFVDGLSLATLMQLVTRGERERPSPEVVAAVVSGALHGLHAAHEAKDQSGQPMRLVHRDVSPQNILIGVDGIARVLDFGVAKALSRASTTVDGVIKGKPAYMPPEQLRGEDVDRRTDVFAMGIVLWEALTGRRLFPSADLRGAVASILSAEIDPPSFVAEDIPPALDAVVMRALEREPDDRFASALGMASALEAAVTLASPRQVGAWVRKVGGLLLESRQKRIEEINTIALPPDEGETAPSRASDEEEAPTPRRVDVLPLADDAPTIEALPDSSSPGVARDVSRVTQQPKVLDAYAVSRSRLRLVAAAVALTTALGGAGALVRRLVVSRGAHAGASASAAAGPCSGASVCTSFETEKPFDGYTSDVTQSGTIALVEGPRGGHALGASNTGAGTALLRRPIAIGTGLTCDFDVKIASFEGEAYFFGLTIDARQNGGFDYWWLQVGKRSDKLTLLQYAYDGATTEAYPIATPPPANTWVHAKLDVELKSDHPNAAFAINGAQMLKVTLPAPRTASFVLEMGVIADKHSGAADSVAIANVVCASR